MKVDVTKIENFESMTDAEKLEAVLNYEMEVPQAEPIKDDAETLKLKEAFNKASSEVAEYKRQLKAKETAEETARREAAERESAIMEELNQLRKERTTSTYTAKYMEIGYDADTARALADTLPDGLGDDFFTRQKSFLEDTIQKTKAQVLNQQPQPTAGQPLTGKQAEDAELQQLRKWSGLK
jgi:hypothetical protein